MNYERTDAIPLFDSKENYIMIQADTLSSVNPLSDPTIGKTAAPCIVTIFGATGDLTAKKLLPALYNLAKEGLLPPHFICIGFARREKSHEQFRAEMFEAISKYSRTKPIDQNLWNQFSQQIFYHKSAFDDPTGYESYKELLRQMEPKYGTKGNRIFYLSTPPSYFPMIVDQLHQHQLIYDKDQVSDKFSRVIVEKPFGHDITSAQALQKDLTVALSEKQIFRIDHYLGKETVQNLMVFRFGNPIFESMWNNRYIDHVQITVSEDHGVGTRGHFFEEAGMLRDIIQNHMMQLLSLIAMEPPVNLQADSIQDEKVKVLQSIRPIPKDRVDQYTVRGQYGMGFIQGEQVSGYRQEKDVAPQSNVETYAALELYIDNWRWSQVPFFLRSGKRLPKRATEISVFFKEAPSVLFNSDRSFQNNVLVIRIQPDESIALKINSKVPGAQTLIQPVKMDFRYGSYFGTTPPEAYERLLCDCMTGDSTLFAREDEVMASWNILEPIIDVWTGTVGRDFPNYAAGTWGPKSADALVQRSGRAWRMI